jgi:N-acetylglucosaminyl-diphospho-decaprenol L-rhamnosyltransferase
VTGAPAADADPLVDVIVVTHNPGSLLPRALASIAASRGVRIRMSVVDNASTDGTADRARALGAEVVPMPANLGYGAALNRGVAGATAPWAVCCNQDVDVDQHAIARLVRTAEAYEGVHGVPCVVGPRLVRPDGTTAETCHRLPTLGRQIAEFLLGERAAGNRNRGTETDGAQRCGWVSATFLLARASTFRSVDGFDPRYFMYVEDVDFFARLAAAGGHCVWEPRATVTHLGGDERVWSPQLYAHALWNWKQYFDARTGGFGGTAVLAAAVVGSLGRAALWWARSVDTATARARARMFAGAALIASRRLAATWAPSRRPA